MRRELVIVATRSVRSPAYLAPRAIRPPGTDADYGSNAVIGAPTTITHYASIKITVIAQAYSSDLVFNLVSQSAVRFGWASTTRRAATSSLPAGPRHHVHSSIPVAALTPFNRVANPEMFKHLQSHPAQSTLQRPPPPGEGRRQSTSLRLGRHASNSTARHQRPSQPASSPR